MAYATVAQLRQYLHNIPADAATDAILIEILDRATDLVDDELQFSFAAYAGTATERDVWSGAGGAILYLPPYESGSLAAVALVTGRGATSETETAVTDYVEDARWRLYRDAGWTAWSWYRVEAEWGYGPAPDTIVQATLEIAVNIWRGRDAMQFQGKLGAADGGAVPYRRAMTWELRRSIGRVRSQYPQEPQR